jgi:hypothetical protein
LAYGFKAAVNVPFLSPSSSPPPDHAQFPKFSKG